MLLLPCFAWAQTQEIPKNSDKIIVINQQTSEQNFIKVKQALADRDIEIATQDRDIFQIKTALIRSTENGGYSFLINCKDGKVSFTGTWGSNLGLNIGGITQAPSIYKIQYKGAQKYFFNKMKEFAETFGTEIRYETTVIMVKPPKNQDDLYGY
ncbi:hypothetical protein LY11_05300 [Pedobacter cryoconitis]|uniref:Uncharacterized protein n=2 Tax=Pedobacter cryoconitis TaxID=188932 RepID=A0A327RQF4_9SPHI|nr:hypothetical protein LY11_05300 [Pedobacter cryoconitis]